MTNLYQKEFIDLTILPLQRDIDNAKEEPKRSIIERSSIEATWNTTKVVSNLNNNCNLINSWVEQAGNTKIDKREISKQGMENNTNKMEAKRLHTITNELHHKS